MNDDDLAARLDHSFGEGPAHRPLEQTLARGRRRLLRQRLASGAAVAVVVGVAATTSALVAGGSEPVAGLDPAAPGTCEGRLLWENDAGPVMIFPDGEPGVATTSPDPSSAYESELRLGGVPDECVDAVTGSDVQGSTSGMTGPILDGRSDMGHGVDLDARGRLHREPGTTIVERIDNPLGWTEPDHSVAVLRESDGTSRWLLLTFDRHADEDCATWTTVETEPLPGQPLQQWAERQGGRLTRDQDECAEASTPGATR